MSIPSATFFQLNVDIQTPNFSVSIQLIYLSISRPNGIVYFWVILCHPLILSSIKCDSCESFVIHALTDFYNIVLLTRNIV